jgi:hypothetical protein
MCHEDHSTVVREGCTILGWDGQCVDTGVQIVDRRSVDWYTDGLHRTGEC